MKKWNFLFRAGAGFLLSAALVFGGIQTVKNQITIWDQLEDGGIQEDSGDLTIRMSGFGVNGSRRISSTAGKMDVGPGVKLFGGGRLTLLANKTDSQMLSCVIETGKGGLIVIDGGTTGDATHLMETIRAKGGRVNAWLITHPHSDHVGALNTILNTADSQITIDNLYYSFNNQEWYNTYEAYRADMVAQLTASFATLPAEKLHGDLKKGQEIIVDDVKIAVLNDPFFCDYNSINNSSVAYSVMLNGKRIVFLGDLGVEGGNNLLSLYKPEELKCDILQMAHHGQHGVERNVYEALKPQICLWPTPGWLWDNDSGTGAGSGSWVTPMTRDWMKEIGAKMNYCIKDGDQILE